jgi:DNA (cytosine-5)-methyltransferase 1
MGLHQAWPDAEITGVDIIPQPRYPFDFIQADALTYGSYGWLLSFDFVWASPPCQHYSQVTPKTHRANHPDLIEPTRQRLQHLHAGHVIENVIGAPLNHPVILCGSMFGLQTRRHRQFEANFPLIAPRACDHSAPVLLVTTAGANSRAIRKPGHYKSVKNAPLAYGIDWMTANGLKEAIPPAYSRWIALQYFNPSTVEERQS